MLLLFFPITIFAQSDKNEEYLKSLKTEYFINEKYKVLNAIFNYSRLPIFYGMEDIVICENFEIPLFPPYPLVRNNKAIFIVPDNSSVMRTSNCIIVGYFFLNVIDGHSGIIVTSNRHSKNFYFSLKRYFGKWTVVYFMIDDF